MKKLMTLFTGILPVISIAQITTQTVAQSSVATSNTIVSTYTIRTTNTLLVNDNMFNFQVSSTSSVNTSTASGVLELTDPVGGTMEAYVSKQLNTNLYDSIRINLDVASSVSNTCYIGVFNTPFQNIPINGSLSNYQPFTALHIPPSVSPSLAPTSYSLRIVVAFPNVSGYNVYLKNLNVKSYYTSVVSVTTVVNGVGIPENVNSKNVLYVNGNCIHSAQNNPQHEITVSDLTGKLVYKSALQNEMNTLLSPGIYFLNVLDERKVLMYSKKVLILE